MCAMPKLRYSDDALADLEEIKAYIETELSNPTAAINTVKKITTKLRLLEQFPGAGSSLTNALGAKTDLQFLVCGNYLAFYRVRDDDVHVARVLYGKRDYIAVLFGELPDES